MPVAGVNCVPGHSVLLYACLYGVSICACTFCVVYVSVCCLAFLVIMNIYFNGEKQTGEHQRKRGRGPRIF